MTIKEIIAWILRSDSIEHEGNQDGGLATYPERPKGTERPDLLSEIGE